ncbi:MAG: GPW/gp25 family protein [Gemmatimonadetes bacterium]|nr:GPW/gp25 family protein [Gemmatimonadota bacterium]
MNAARYRAWRFLYPGIDVPEAEAGPALSPAGGIEMVEDAAAIRQSILMLLSTVPGERVMRPDYGCDLRKLVFSPNDGTTQGLAIHYVRQALERWEPRIEIVRLDAEASAADPGRLDITLEYRVRATQSAESLTYGLGLSGR